MVAYLGHDLLLEDVLIKPVNSLLVQSKHAKETQMPTNGDGFGVSWYTPTISKEPGLFNSIFPAWNDQNLRHMASKIQSPCFFGHIRAATAGGVTNYNCHPFIHSELQFMHNGKLGNFMAVKRHLRHCLDDDIYNWIKGETDSEHLFALFLQHAKKEKGPMNSDKMTTLLIKTISHALSLVKEHGDGATSFLNLCVSNGKSIVASRIDTSPSGEARTLHYSLGKKFEFVNGKAHMQKSDDKNNAILITSEILNDCEAEWVSVEKNSLITVDEAMTVKSQAYRE
jgi:glutamine amidotransferase